LHSRRRTWRPAWRLGFEVDQPGAVEEEEGDDDDDDGGGERRSPARGGGGGGRGWVIDAELFSE
jgi:hypothetical protein